MSSNELLIIAGLIVLALLGIGRLHIRHHKKVLAENLRRKQVEEQRAAIERRETLGWQLVQCLQAVAKNSQAHFFEGKLAPGYGPVQVGYIARNGDNFSVIVKLPDRAHIHGAHNVLQADVGLARYHMFIGPYGPDRNFNSFQDLQSEAARYLEGYRMFSR